MNAPFVDSDSSWATSPCSTCRTSPCCTRLPLHRFHIENRHDFEWARCLLEHPRIDIGLYDSGWWMAYYLAPCRFLNPFDSKCLIHGSPRQPRICRDYSPAGCWYKRVFVEPDTQRLAGFIRFDSSRFAVLTELIEFDSEGELAEVPEWEELSSRIGALPLRQQTAAGPSPEVAAPPTGEPPQATGGLVFPIRTPRTRRDLDVVRFRLGFHGVRVGIRDEQWITVIGNPHEIAGFEILTYDRIDAFLAGFEFDESGAIIRLGSARPIRDAVSGAST